MNRPSFNLVWAQDGVAIDPDLDTTAPSYVANKYQGIGWIVQKPPEQWQNFLQQITDLKLVEYLSNGLFTTDSSVVYKAGGIRMQGGVVYKMTSSTASTTVLSINKADFAKIVADMTTKINNHISTINAHKDTVDTIIGKTYLKGDVDNSFGSPTNAKTIVYHKLQKGPSVHGETPLSIGTVPAAGGTFTGQVVLERALFPSNGILDFNEATALVNLLNAAGGICIAVNGRGFVQKGSAQSLIVSEAIEPGMTLKYNNEFALPLPYLKADFRNSLSSIGIGNWTTQSASDPVFANGGLQISDNVISLIFKGSATKITSVAICVSDGVVETLIGDFDSWTPNPSGGMNSSTLMPAYTALGGKGKVVQIKEYTVYPRLTTYQKSMLVK